MKKRILGYTKFLESKKLNEGGGAGITFELNDTVASTGIFKVTLKDITVISESCDIGESFNALGYDDGMRDAGTWMLNTKCVTPNLSTILSAKLEEDGSTIESALNKGMTIELDASGWYKNAEAMHFGGWIRGKFNDGDILMDVETIKEKYDLQSECFVKVNGKQYVLDNNSSDAITVEMFPTVTITKLFIEFYNSVFNSQNEDFKEFLKSEIKDNDLDDDILDDDILSFLELEDSEEDSTEDIVNFKDQLTTDEAAFNEFFEWLYNKFGSYCDDKWHSFLDIQKDDWGVNGNRKTSVNEAKKMDFAKMDAKAQVLGSGNKKEVEDTKPKKSDSEKAIDKGKVAIAKALQTQLEKELELPTEDVWIMGKDSAEREAGTTQPVICIRAKKNDKLYGKIRGAIRIYDPKLKVSIKKSDKEAKEVRFYLIVK